MARRLLSILLALVISIVLIGFFLPREVVVQRTQFIDTLPSTAFAVLNDLRHFNQWSPWYARSPEAGYRLEGPTSGVGATLAWSDEQGSGAGRMWIVESVEPEAIELRMELGETESENFFRIRPLDGGSEVVWGMRMRFGTLDLTGRYIGLMLPGLLGDDFSDGLARLKTYLEADPGRVPPVPDTLEPSNFPGRSPESP
jgi:hypothetical protein